MMEVNHNSIIKCNNFYSYLSEVINKYKIPSNTKFIILNLRQNSYDRTKQGLHPIEVKLQHDSSTDSWEIMFLASFSYFNEHSTSLEMELYFHLINDCCYQPDVGAMDLSNPSVMELLNLWITALSRHLSRNAFDDIQLSIIPA